MAEAHDLRDRRKQQSGNRNIKAMIGKGSSLPSATAEEEVIRVPMQNQIAADAKTNGSERKSKTKPIIHLQWRGTNQITFDSGMIQIHSKAAIKLDQTVDYFKC